VLVNKATDRAIRICIRTGIPVVTIKMCSGQYRSEQRNQCKHVWIFERVCSTPFGVNECCTGT
jgi:hypothetical protein